MGSRDQDRCSFYCPGAVSNRDGYLKSSLFQWKLATMIMYLVDESCIHISDIVQQSKISSRVCHRFIALPLRTSFLSRGPMNT